MEFIQFRVHPSVGMARIGESKDWYFLGPEIPRFIQEQFPNLRHQPGPLRHPAKANAAAVAPSVGRYRDTSPTNLIMPQAARFRVFAYVYAGAGAEPRKVMELKPEHADIEWTVKVANVKSVKSGAVQKNEPPAQLLTTKAPPSSQTKCQTGTFPNLAWLELEKGSGGTPTGRLHVIGNEGEAKGGALANFPSPYLYQEDWHDPAADGPVSAVVELKPAFKSLFSGSKYLIPGQKDPMTLPVDNKVAAVPAWVVVNVPDYVPDMGHFVSLWDMALNQAWKYVADGKAVAVDGQHKLATAKNEVNTYLFYDYFTHIYPQLGLFSDVAYTSGQARAGTFNSSQYLSGIALRGQLTAAASAAGTTLKIAVKEALGLKVASLDQPFTILLSPTATNPLGGAHEFVLCTAVATDGTLTVTRAQRGTVAAPWSGTTRYFAATKASFIETKLKGDINAAVTKITIDVQSAHKMPEPTPPGPNSRDNPFKLALLKGPNVEWMSCTLNNKTGGELAVTRGVDGTAKLPWSNGDTIIATALGHKRLDARARAPALAKGARGPIHDMLFKRLRLPSTVYGRTTFTKVSGSPQTGYPREFGRRLTFDTVDPGGTHSGAVNVNPKGSLARFHTLFTGMQKKACKGGPVPLDALKSLPAGDTVAYVNELDDYYWIVSERDMPMLKEYAFTYIQYNHLEYWATGKMDKGHYTRWTPLFEILFKGSSLETFFAQAHSMEEYVNELFKIRPRYAPAFLDMASMGRMLGGSFLPGIEVGREGGKATNWSFVHGGTIYFPDIRFHPQGKAPGHKAGTLTKDLAIPWFADYIGCEEDFWPTSRPQVVYQNNGLAYSWLSKSEHTTTEPAFRDYWKKLGFIRRQPNDEFFEEEAVFTRP